MGYQKNCLSRSLVACALSVLLLTGCETTADVLDAANPVNWFKKDGTVEAEAETAQDGTVDTDPTNSASTEIPNANAPIPAIGAVPERPATPAIRRDYEELRQGLVADRENARYSDEELRRESPKSTSLIPAAPTQVAISGQPQASEPKANPLAVIPSDPPTARVSSAPTAGPATADSETAALLAGAQARVRPAPTPAPLVNDRTSTPAAAPAVAQADTGAQAATPAANTATTAARPAALAGIDSSKPVAILYFPTGGAELAARDQAILDAVADYARQGVGYVRIVGHSSSDVGIADAQQAGLVNYKVSLSRAQAVADHLQARGIAAPNLLVEARGANEPLYQESTAAGVAGNRRVEIFFVF